MPIVLPEHPNVLWNMGKKQLLQYAKENNLPITTSMNKDLVYKLILEHKKGVQLTTDVINTITKEVKKTKPIYLRLSNLNHILHFADWLKYNCYQMFEVNKPQSIYLTMKSIENVFWPKQIINTYLETENLTKSVKDSFGYYKWTEIVRAESELIAKITYNNDILIIGTSGIMKESYVYNIIGEKTPPEDKVVNDKNLVDLFWNEKQDYTTQPYVSFYYGYALKRLFFNKYQELADDIMTDICKALSILLHCPARGYEENRHAVYKLKEVRRCKVGGIWKEAEVIGNVDKYEQLNNITFV